MAVHILQRSQAVNASRDEVWRFFSSPHNLARITPPDMAFTVVTPDLPEHIYAGLMIEYRVSPLGGVPITWLSEITHVREGDSFVDEQRLGPYRLWHHEHALVDAGDGRMMVADRVTYALPGGWLGELLHPWLVEPQLERIFRFREEAIRRVFPG